LVTHFTKTNEKLTQQSTEHVKKKNKQLISFLFKNAYFPFCFTLKQRQTRPAQTIFSFLLVCQILMLPSAVWSVGAPLGVGGAS
jgi:hypothetical protein